MKYKLETELAQEVVKYLTAEGWDCYFEVKCIDDSPIDIVAIKNMTGSMNSVRVWAIECKLSLSVHLLTQARRLTDYAHFVSVATPFSRRDYDDRQTIVDILAHFKLGWFRAIDAPCNVDANAQAILQALRPEHKTHALPGTNRGGMWTPFKGVAEAVAIFVKENPGTTIKRICEIEAVKDYYKGKSHAQSAIRGWLKKGVIKHVRVECKHGKYSYWPFSPSDEPRI